MKSTKLKTVKKPTTKNHACYLLITCAEPSADGNMKVEMTYKGDTALASYLLQGAQTLMDEQEIYYS